MELSNQKRFAGHILRLLRVSYIDFPIGRTSKGNLALHFDESGDFTIMLDSVPLSTKNSLEDENNIELKRMVEKYWFEEQKAMSPMFISENPEKEGLQRFKEEVHLIGARKGRPKGSKNKSKLEKAEIAG